MDSRRDQVWIDCPRATQVEKHQGNGIMIAVDALQLEVPKKDRCGICTIKLRGMLPHLNIRVTCVFSSELFSMHVYKGLIGGQWRKSHKNESVSQARAWPNSAQTR